MSTIKIKFLGNTLPECAYLLRYSVKPNVCPPRECFNGLRFGHSAQQCRFKPKCQVWDEEHETQSCTPSSSPIRSIRTISCINCKGNPICSPMSCPVYVEEFGIKKLNAYDN